MKAFRLTVLFLVMTMAGAAGVLFYIYYIILAREINRSEILMSAKAINVAARLKDSEIDVKDFFTTYSMAVADMPAVLIVTDANHNILAKAGLSDSEAVRLLGQYYNSNSNLGISHKVDNYIFFRNNILRKDPLDMIYGLDKGYIYSSIRYIPFQIAILIGGLLLLFIFVFYSVILFYVENPLRIVVEERLSRTIQRIALRNNRFREDLNTPIPNGFLSAGLKRVLNQTMYLLENWALNKRVFEDFSGIALLEKDKENIFRILYSMTMNRNHITRMTVLESTASTDRLDLIYSSDGEHYLQEIMENPDRCLAFRGGGFIKQDKERVFCPACTCGKDQIVICYPLLGGAKIIGIAQFIIDEKAVELELSSGNFAVEDRILLIENELSDLIRIAGSAASGLNMIETYRNQAVTDTLTGLYNRRYLIEYLTNTLDVAKRKEDELSILLIDIDYFKKFNDEYGHKTGDRVLKAVSDTMKNAVRDGDVIGRYGGEEFVVILPQTGSAQATEIAERLREDVSNIDYQRYEINNIPKITVSIGIAQFPLHGYSHYHLTSAADRALYAAKNSGRNRVKLHESLPPSVAD
jgi:diguanylate cyclase (GGDEF)-like protein